jgi:hypothetical protein
MSDRRYARNQTLPEEEALRLDTLTGITLHYRCKELYLAGWTFRAIGQALSPQRGKSTVHAWVMSVPEVFPATGLPVPSVEYATPAEYVPKKPKAPPVSHADAQRLRDLAPSVRRYRGAMAASHPVALKVQEFSDICNRLHGSGTPIQTLADIADVSYSAIYKRIEE